MVLMATAVLGPAQIPLMPKSYLKQRRQIRGIATAQYDIEVIIAPIFCFPDARMAAWAMP